MPATRMAPDRGSTAVLKAAFWPLSVTDRLVSTSEPAEGRVVSVITRPRFLASRSAFTRFTVAVVTCSRMPLMTMARRRRVSRSSPRGDSYVIPTSVKPPSPPTSCTAVRPRPAARDTNGCSSFRTSGGIIGAFTAVAAISPLRAATTTSDTSTDTSSWASAVEAPRWGVHTTSGRPTSGWSAGGGSTANTSRAAAATWPASRARASAWSSMTPPRATFTMRAPFLILANTSSPNRFLVVGVRGMCREWKSALARHSSSDRSCTPWARAFSSLAYGSYAITVMPSPLARLATSLPTLPKPMIARVLSTKDTPTYFLRAHLPSFTLLSAWATLRLNAHRSAIPCSAAAMVLAVGAFTTRHPNSVAAVRSTLSTPTPARPTTLRRPPAASNTSLVTCDAERMMSAS
mmetsp:Transcript_15202/g.45841  ORF Transcript_15202/g.45841 Transcript_15202/m.45841 type:complete len:404 (-) Transcript_15202:444-1655(-)